MDESIRSENGSSRTHFVYDGMGREAGVLF